MAIYSTAKGKNSVSILTRPSYKKKARKDDPISNTEYQANAINRRQKIQNHSANTALPFFTVSTDMPLTK
eukprot:1515436-Ditylum_brightwellii.AAC.1